jgi:WD40 repeat protein
MKTLLWVGIGFLFFSVCGTDIFTLAQERPGKEKKEEKSAKDLIAEAKRAIGKEDVKKAKQLLRKALEIDPNNKEAKDLRSKITGYPGFEELRTLSRDKFFEVHSVCFSPDGHALATGDIYARVTIWEASTGEKLWELTGAAGPKPIESVCFRPDGRAIAFGVGSFGHISVLAAPEEKSGSKPTGKKEEKIDYSTFKEVYRLDGHRGGTNSVSFRPKSSGVELASGGADNNVRLWNVYKGIGIIADSVYVDVLIGHGLPVKSVSFAPDGAKIASGGTDSTVKIWDVKNQKELRTLMGHKGSVNTVSFSPDGKTVVSGSSDSTIKVWDVETGKELRTFKGHKSAVSCVSFSPDGKAIVSGSADCTVKIWEVETGKEMRTLKEHKKAVNSVCFSPDGRTIASGASCNAEHSPWHRYKRVQIPAPPPLRNALPRRRAPPALGGNPFSYLLSGQTL